LSPCRNISKSRRVNVRFWGHACRIVNFANKSGSECLDWKVRRAERIYEFRGKKFLVQESLGRPRRRRKDTFKVNIFEK